MALVVDSTRDAPVALVDLGELDPIAGLIQSFRLGVSLPGEGLHASLKATAQELNARLWKPLEHYIAHKAKVYLVPDGVLHLLPFGALIDEKGRYLAQAHDLVLLASSRDLVVAPAEGQSTEPTIFSAPEYDFPGQSESTDSGEVRASRTSGLNLSDVHFNPLPGTAREGERIARLMQQHQQAFRHYTGADATEAALAEVSHPRILHLATHGFFLDGLAALEGDGGTGLRGFEPVTLEVGGGQIAPSAALRPKPVGNPLLRSGLALTGANLGVRGIKQKDGNDGILTAMEVLSLDLVGTDLVVLSACETGVGDIKQGQGVYGLRRAFQEAGAKVVLSTLWSIDDEGTQAFMDRFYNLYLGGTPPQQALLAVQREFIADSRWKHPYYWAPFVMVGVE